MKSERANCINGRTQCVNRGNETQSEKTSYVNLGNELKSERTSCDNRRKELQSEGTFVNYDSLQGTCGGIFQTLTKLKLLELKWSAVLVLYRCILN